MLEINFSEVGGVSYQVTQPHIANVCCHRGKKALNKIKVVIPVVTGLGIQETGCISIHCWVLESVTWVTESVLGPGEWEYWVRVESFHQMSRMWLEGVAAFAEAISLVPSTHRLAHNWQFPLLASEDVRHACGIQDLHASKTSAVS